MHSYYLLLLAILTISLRSDAQTSCQNQRRQFRDCMRGAQAGTQRVDPQARRQQREQCFTSNRCTPPNSDRRTCIHEMTESVVKPMLQDCVKDIIPDFVFPEGRSGGGGGGRGWRGNRNQGAGQSQGQGQRQSSFMDSLNKACPTQAAAQAAMNCLKQLRSQGRSSQGGSPNTQQCTSKFLTNNDACADERRNTDSAICMCATDHQTEIQQAYSLCPPPQNGQNYNATRRYCRNAGADQSGQGQSFGGSSRGGGSGSGSNGGSFGSSSGSNGGSFGSNSRSNGGSFGSNSGSNGGSFGGNSGFNGGSNGGFRSSSGDSGDYEGSSGPDGDYGSSSGFNRGFGGNSGSNGNFGGNSGSNGNFGGNSGFNGGFGGGSGSGNFGGGGGGGFNGGFSGGPGSGNVGFSGGSSFGGPSGSSFSNPPPPPNNPRGGGLGGLGGLLGGGGGGLGGLLSSFLGGGKK